MSNIKSIKLLKANKNFRPLPVDEGDEIYRNGIFHFNITKMVDYIRRRPDEFMLELIAIKDYSAGFSLIDENYLDSVVNFEPVILAEITPGRYNLIDGNHRAEKARRLGKEKLMAYKLKVNQHIKFLTTQRAYAAYIEYWNDKIKGMKEVV